MRLRSLLVPCAVTLYACSTPAPGKKAALDAMIARSDAMQAAEASMKTDSVLAFWADDAVIQLPGAPQIEGRDAVRAFYSGMFATAGLRKFEVIPGRVELATSMDLAYEYGVTRTTVMGPKGDSIESGKYLRVWKKFGNTWLVVAESGSNDASSPAPAPK